MPSCKRDGYSLYTDGQWLDLNKKSSTSVFQAIKASKRKKGFYAEVAGKVEDKLVTVEKVTEIEEPEQPAEGRSEAK
ncbi:MAG: hypothetical protein JST44_12405 [Cyanobacteria bacterium SZAS LIN-5]|jgi:hypothetical protein|nr:hypothetical protein [Cyanobacteria bacterium SZAS LIN-5]